MNNDPLVVDTITIYNRFPVGLPPFPPRVRFDRTVIRNVMWKDATHNNPDSNGRSFIDQTVSITIPKEAKADGNKQYIDPVGYSRLPIDDTNHWTLNNDPSNPDVIVFGDCPKEINDLYTITQLQRDYKTMIIKSVSDSTNQGILPMWKVTGV
jgi:hypothetical protein